MTICDNPVDSGGNIKLSEMKFACLPQPFFLFFFFFYTDSS